MEGDARGIEKEISDIDTKIDDLKRKSTDQEKLLNDIKANPEKFKPAEIESLLTTLDELLEKAE
jgi:peptidoglycan hydrolase CwlO-like protein